MIVIGPRPADRADSARLADTAALGRSQHTAQAVVSPEPKLGLMGRAVVSLCQWGKNPHWQDLCTLLLST